MIMDHKDGSIYQTSQRVNLAFILDHGNVNHIVIATV